MQVEIWSDIVCPFCYIGKRRFEQALSAFSGKDQVEVQWRSFQLDPEAQPEAGKSLAQNLSEKKGWSLEQTTAMMAHVTQMAKDSGLEYRMDKAVIANTFDAHRLAHLAAQYGLQDAAEERLFQAYFSEGADIGDQQVLAHLGKEIGVPAEEIETTFTTNRFADAVHQDQQAAQQVGARGVPFFVFNNKYAVSGAQSPEVFAQVLQKINEEEQAEGVMADQSFCTPDGECR